MRLTFNSAYKSIQSFPTMDLPPFTVITGLNGSGKTHLLHAIAQGNLKVDEPSIDKSEIHFFNWTTLVPNDLKPVDSRNLQDAMRDELWWIVMQSSDHQKALWHEFGNKHGSALIDGMVENIASLSDIELARLRGGDPRRSRDFHRTFQGSTLQRLCVKSYDPRLIYKLREVRNQLDNPPIGLSYAVFFAVNPFATTKADFFQQRFGEVFALYHDAHVRNDFARYLTESRGIPTPFLTEEQFQAVYGESPWITVNRLFETARLPLRINNPSGTYAGQEFVAELYHIEGKVPVKFSDLSSGEQIIMSLAICLYHAQDTREVYSFPKLLLLDEIDAPLHPSMTQSLLKVIQETFVNQLQINVFLATHSPSTVALAPDNSLYLMTFDSDRLVRTPKDAAVAALTAGVPTLSIRWENRRQVFVESNHDVSFYDKLFLCLKNRLHDEVSLNFIASGGEKGGNCDQVKALVNSLVKYGNHTVYGIIDTDNSNYGNERIRVLRRHSIENYIFDPLLVAAFLQYERILARHDIGLATHEKYSDLVTFNSVKLQTIADNIIALVAAQSTDKSDETLIECVYCNGAQLHLPNWYLRMRGHDLEEAFKDSFPQLKRYRREAELKQRILATVVEDTPDLLSVDIVELFTSIQNG